MRYINKNCANKNHINYKKMDNLKALFWIALFNAAFNSISVRAFSSPIGPFYCIQEGFFPRVFENEYMKYETIVKAPKTDPEDRRIYGNFTFKVPMEKIGVVSEMYKESNKEWQQYGKNFTTEDLCNSQTKAVHFNNRFNAPLNPEKCSVPAGTYYLDGYNVEDDVRESTDTMVYGHWKMKLHIQADVNGKRTTVFPMTYQLWFNDDAKRKQPSNSGSRGNRGNKKPKSFFD